jgi:hypothetical protein
LDSKSAADLATSLADALTELRFTGWNGASIAFSTLAWVDVASPVGV